MIFDVGERTVKFVEDPAGNEDRLTAAAAKCRDGIEDPVVRTSAVLAQRSIKIRGKCGRSPAIGSHRPRVCAVKIPQHG